MAAKSSLHFVWKFFATAIHLDLEGYRQGKTERRLTMNNDQGLICGVIPPVHVPWIFTGKKKKTLKMSISMELDGIHFSQFYSLEKIWMAINGTEKNQPQFSMSFHSLIISFLHTSLIHPNTTRRALIPKSCTHVKRLSMLISFHFYICYPAIIIYALCIWFLFIIPSIIVLYRHRIHVWQIEIGVRFLIQSSRVRHAGRPTNLSSILQLQILMKFASSRFCVSPHPQSTGDNSTVS